MSDSVNHPPHYNQGGIETIDGIRAALGESFADYCRGNVLKYVWRCGKKGDALEDLRKAAKYLQWAIEAMEADASEVPNSSIPEPGPGYRLLSKDPPEGVIKGDEFYFDGKWEESGNWSTNGLQTPSYYYRREIEAAQ